MLETHERFRRALEGRLPHADRLLRPSLLLELVALQQRRGETPEAIASALCVEVERRLARIRTIRETARETEAEFAQKIAVSFFRGELDRIDRQIYQKELALRFESCARRSEPLASQCRGAFVSIVADAEKWRMAAAAFDRAQKAPFLDSEQREIAPQKKICVEKKLRSD